MHKVRIHKKNYKLPDKWTELSEKKLSEIIFYIIQDEGTEEARKLKTLIQLLDLKGKQQLSLFLNQTTDVQKCSLISDCVNWLFETYPVTPAIKKLKFLRTYIPPRTKLENISFGEFVFADSYFEQYMQSRDMKDLDKLIACLYRPKRNILYCLFNPFANDYRIKFNTVQVDQAAKLFGFLPIVKKLSILLFYIGCRKFIVNQYPAIFESNDYSSDPDLPEELRQRLKEAKESETSGHNFGWLAMANNISKSGQYGTYEQTMDTNAHTVLYNFSMDLIQSKNNKQ